MSQAANDSSEPVDEWTVYYWPLRNRGNFVRLVLAYAEQEFNDVSNPAQLKKLFASSKPLGKPQKDSDKKNDEKSDDGYFSPPFAGPALKYVDGKSKETLFISQMLPCAEFAATKFGLTPKADTFDAFRAKKLMLDCNDILNEFRGKIDDENKITAQKYVQFRLKKWLNVLQYPLKNKKDENKDNIYYFGDKVTYVDLAVFNIIDGIKDTLSEKLFDDIFKQYPELLAIFNTIGETKQIKQFIEKQKKNGMAWYPQSVKNQARSNLKDLEEKIGATQ